MGLVPGRLRVPAARHLDGRRSRPLRNPDLGPPWTDALLAAYADLNRITADELHRCLMVAGLRMGKLELLTEALHIPPELDCLPPSLVGISGIKLLAHPR